MCLFKELEAKERAIEQEREALRRRIVEEERQRLLKHHATKLLGYLPKVWGHVWFMNHITQVHILCRSNKCMTMSVSILRAYSVKMTWSTLTRTSEKTLKRVRRISSLKTAGKTMVRFFPPEIAYYATRWQHVAFFLVSSSFLSGHLFSIQQQDDDSEHSTTRRWLRNIFLLRLCWQDLN